MGKRRDPYEKVPKRGIRIIEGERAARKGFVSVAWKYDNEYGQWIWLRPASGVSIRDDLGARER